MQKEGGNIHTEKNRRKKTPLSLFSARVPGGGFEVFKCGVGSGKKRRCVFSLSLSLSLFPLARMCDDICGESGVVAVSSLTGLSHIFETFNYHSLRDGG